MDNSMSDFNIFDIILAVIFTYFTVLCTFYGFIRVFVYSIMLGLSLFGMYLLFPWLKPFVGRYTENELILVFLTGIIAFFISELATSLVKRQVLSLLNPFSRTITNKILGSALGVIISSSICILLYFISIIFFNKEKYGENLYESIKSLKPEHYPDWVKDATLYHYLKNVDPKIILEYPELKARLESIKFHRINSKSLPRDIQEEDSHHIKDNNNNDENTKGDNSSLMHRDIVI